MDQQGEAAIEVDARGLSCPIPVIRVKDAITNNPGAAICVLIDDQETEENVRRLAQGLGWSAVRQRDDSHDLLLSPG